MDKYIGETPEKRADKLRSLHGISPLFYIATMFNIDMSYNVNSAEANESAGLEGRWEARFDKVLIKECFGASMGWYKNWDAEDSLFRNSYLLRDFKYSGVGGSNLYEGFGATGSERKWMIPANNHTPENELVERGKKYYEAMRASFIGNKYVGRLFEDPALSWDVAATMNNDGALYIIQRLGQVCDMIAEFRSKQCADDVKAAVKAVYRAIADYYVSQDGEVILRENIRKSKTIHREMDMACNNDNYFFGHLIQNLQLRENDALFIVHSLIQGNKLNDKSQNFSQYEIIFMHCDKFKGCANDEERWDRLISVYGFLDRDEAEKYLESKGVDPVILFRSNFERKRNSYIIAAEILSYWENRIQSIDTLKQFTSNGQFDPVVMGYLIGQIIQTSHILDLESHLSDAIAGFVNVTNISTVNEGLVADVLAEVVNEFVVDLGYGYLTADEIANAKKTAHSDSALTLKYLEFEQPDDVSEEYLTDLFDGNAGEPAPLTPAFENNYFKWLDFVVIAFISHLTCPDYNREANDKLAIIMEGLK